MWTVLLWVLCIAYIGVCAWLVLVVLLQEGKQGGMAAMDGGSSAPSALTESLGAGGAQKHLFRTTVWTAGIFFVLAIVLTLVANQKERAGGSLNLEAGDKTAETTPAAETSATPAETSTPASTPAK